jgi:hypothetical protein
MTPAQAKRNVAVSLLSVLLSLGVFVIILGLILGWW